MATSQVTISLGKKKRVAVHRMACDRPKGVGEPHKARRPSMAPDLNLADPSSRQAREKERPE